MYALMDGDMPLVLVVNKAIGLTSEDVDVSVHSPMLKNMDAIFNGGKKGRWAFIGSLPS